MTVEIIDTGFKFDDDSERNIGSTIPQKVTTNLSENTKEPNLDMLRGLLNKMKPIIPPTETTNSQFGPPIPSLKKPDPNLRDLKIKEIREYSNSKIFGKDIRESGLDLSDLEQKSYEEILDLDQKVKSLNQNQTAQIDNLVFFFTGFLEAISKNNQNYCLIGLTNNLKNDQMFLASLEELRIKVKTSYLSSLSTEMRLFLCFLKCAFLSIMTNRMMKRSFPTSLVNQPKPSDKVSEKKQEVSPTPPTTFGREGRTAGPPLPFSESKDEKKD